MNRRDETVRKAKLSQYDSTVEGEQPVHIFCYLRPLRKNRAWLVQHDVAKLFFVQVVGAGAASPAVETRTFQRGRRAHRRLAVAQELPAEGRGGRVPSMLNQGSGISPGPVSTDLWLGKDGVAHTVARATGVDPDTARKDVLASTSLESLPAATLANRKPLGATDPRVSPRPKSQHGTVSLTARESTYPLLRSGLCIS